MLSRKLPAPKMQDHVVEHVQEPTRLILAWQAPDQFKERFRWAVGQVSRANSDYTFRYFDDEEFSILNQGRKPEELWALGYRGYPVFAPDKNVTYTKSVLSSFMRRLPPRSRTDFAAYIHSFHLSPSISLSDFSLLAVTEAKLPSDGFSLVDEFADPKGPREMLLEVAGHRYYAVKVQNRLVVGYPVEIEAEPTNPHDSNAVKVLQAGECIGYINRLQAPAFHTWIREQRVQATLQRLNGSAEKPKAYIFVRVSE